MRAETQRAFERMRDTEMLLDDFDYLTESARLQEAMKAAEEFRAALDKEHSAPPEPRK